MKYVILIGLLLFANGAAAQPGKLDNTFAQDRGVLINFSGIGAHGRSAAIQPDEKIIIAGITGFINITLVRCKKNGEVDSSFGTKGRIFTPLRAPFHFDAFGATVRLQKDGKILVAASDLTSHMFALMRYRSEGLIDSAFGDNGLVTANLDSISNFDKIASMILQDDGKILVAGTSGDPNERSNYFALMRFNLNGSVDNLFGTNGRIKTKLIDHWDYWLNSITLQTDRKIVGVGGSKDSNGVKYLNIIRYNSDGSIDSSFGQNGNIVKKYDGEFSSVVIQSDRKILCLGSSYGNSTSVSILFRYSENGTIDSSFGNAGMITTSIANGDTHLNSLLIQPDEKIIASGHTLGIKNRDFALVRYNANGSLDNSFGISGKVTTDFAGYNDFAYSAIFQKDLKILVVGYAPSGISDCFAVILYDNSGRIDPIFGKPAKAITFKSISTNDNATSLSIKSDDGILLTGQSEQLSDGFLSGIAYDKNGIISNNGSNGRFILKENLHLNASVFWGENLIMRAGQFFTVTTSTLDFALLFQDYLATGYDFITVSFGGHSSAQSLLAQNDNIIISGYAYTGRNYDFALARYNFNIGSIDPDFGINGKVTTDIGVNQDYAYASALQTDEKIILAGTTYNNKQWQIALVRYNSDGSLDKSFGSSGIVTTAINDSDDCAKGIAVQKDGKIVVAGYTRLGTHYDFVVLRYQSNGTLDSTFGSNGITETRIGSTDAKSNGMVIESDGKIILGGYSSNGKDDDFTLACYNPDGTLDKNFGTNGITTTDYGFGDDHINAVALQSDGAIVAAGYAFNGTDKDYAVARYIPHLTLGVIDRKTSEKTISIYPNPIHDKTKVNYELSQSEHVSMKLYDILGNERAIFLNNEMRSEGKNTDEIMLPNSLAAGSYILIIETEKARVSVKVVKSEP